MDQFMRYLHGYVRILVMSRMPERFLRMCAHHQIQLHHIYHRDNGYEMEVSVKDFFRLKQICRKSGSRIRIIQKYGLPFFFYRNKKRKAFFVGILCCMALLAFFSTKIWNINVEGNFSYSTQTILRYLEDEKVVHGIGKKALNCSQIAASLREEFPDIIWVSAKIKGTRLLITIQENMDTYDTEKSQEDGQTQPCDLASETDGLIVDMVTRKGIPQMQPGDTCKKGDILVSGRLEIMNDSQEIVRYEYVEADADIYIQRTYPYYKEFPMVYEKRVYTGEETVRPFFQLMNKRITFTGWRDKYEHFDRVCSQYPLQITENYILPVSVGQIRDCAYVIQKQKYTEAEAQDLAETALTKFLMELSEKGVKISRNDVRIVINEKSCISSGNLTVIEKTGRQVPVEQIQLTEERAQVNEQ